MYNPEFIKTHEMIVTLTNAHYGELKHTKLSWGEIKDPCGNIVQIVPLYEMIFKF